jgi:YggT family protein
MPDGLTAARYAVFALFALAALAALGSWLVRSRRVSPFRPLGRGLRWATDWIVVPVERRLVRMGGNPVHAGWWLIVLVAVGGVIFLSLFGWVLTSYQTAAWVTEQGPRAVLALIVNVLYSAFFIAIMVRVVASWLGWFRYARWMRPVYALTDWLIEPLRRFVPPLGMFDITPLVALLVLWGLKLILLAGLRA